MIKLATRLLDVPDIPSGQFPSEPEVTTATPPPPPSHPTSVSSVSSVSVCPLSVHTETIVRLTNVGDALKMAPPVRGQNNRRLFTLARAFMAVEVNSGIKLTATDVISAFNRWYDTGRQSGQLDPETTRDEYITKFLYARAKAKIPLGPTLDLDLVLAELEGRELPFSANIFDDAIPRRLVGLCELLQEIAGTQPFLLSCRTAATKLGFPNHQAAARCLMALVGAGVLKEISKGVGIKASRYRYNYG